MVTSPVRNNFKSCTPGQDVAVGVPTISKIKRNCSISVLPVNKGRPSTSSAKIQPALQISTAVPYRVAPSNNSGGRYHNVITLLVNSCEFPRLHRRRVTGIINKKIKIKKRGRRKKGRVALVNDDWKK